MKIGDALPTDDAVLAKQIFQTSMLKLLHLTSDNFGHRSFETIRTVAFSMIQITINRMKETRRLPLLLMAT